MQGNELEQTLVLIKPDALKNSLTGYVLSCLSEVHTGLRFAGLKVVHVNRMLAEEHYAEHRGKVFFPSLIEYIMGALHFPGEVQKQRVVAIVYQGEDAVHKIRALAGPTNPLVAREKQPGSLRSLGTLVPLTDEQGNVVGQRMDNLLHASANLSDAEREIKLWFKPNEIPPCMRIYDVAMSDHHYYYLNGRLSTDHKPGSICLLAPGDGAWASDLEALRQIYRGLPAACSLETVVAKYLINEEIEC
jgi:nucleoside-diphosphate kinase